MSKMCPPYSEFALTNIICIEKALKGTRGGSIKKNLGWCKCWMGAVVIKHPKGEAVV